MKVTFIGETSVLCAGDIFPGGPYSDGICPTLVNTETYLNNYFILDYLRQLTMIICLTLS